MYMVTVKEVYVADIKSDGTLGDLKMLIDDLPDAGQHPNRTIAVGPDEKLYITVGSTCNSCDESNKENATVLIANLDGKNRRIFDSGLRNTIGFGWHPVTKKMYGMDHGIDMLGDNDQPEELNELIDGTKYGWAYVYADSKLNPHSKPPKDLGLTNEDWARQSKEPVLMYTPHAAPMEMAFYTGSQFPAEYKNDAFVAFRGSWNRDPPSGYEVVRIHFDQNGVPMKFEPFLTGFLVKGGSSNGKDAHFARLAGVAQAKDGSLLVSDDTNNIVYRVSYSNASMPPIMSRDNISIMLPETSGTAKITVTSSAFAPGAAIPDKYSAYFEGISPNLSWSGAPANTKSYVLMMEDPDAALKPVTHWIMANIPASITNLPGNVVKDDKFNNALQGSNITGKPGYYGPKPPPADKPHGYHFQVFALDTMLNLPSDYNRQALLDAIKGHVIGKGELIGTYQRRPEIKNKE
jgi:Raf kinase inhibitor-like YbhB/YbcL family protein